MTRKRAIIAAIALLLIITSVAVFASLKPNKPNTSKIHEVTNTDAANKNRQQTQTKKHPATKKHLLQTEKTP